MENGEKRGRVEKPVTIEVSKWMKEKLKEMKSDLKLKNMDAVLRDIVKRRPLSRQDPAAFNLEKNNADGEEEDDGKTPLPQTMFASTLVKNVKALKYYTGLSVLAFKWVSQALEKAVLFFIFFSPSMYVNLFQLFVCHLPCIYISDTDFLVVDASGR